MKKIILRVGILGGLLLSFPILAHQGTELGNGTGGEENVEKVMEAQEINKVSRDNFKRDYEIYNESDLNSIMHWGGSSVSKLEEALQQSGHYMDIGRRWDANNTLKKALQQISETFPKRPPGEGSPMTEKLVQRALKYLSKIESSFGKEGYTERELHTQVYFLGEYSRMIISVWRDLDKDYYIPYYHKYHRCHPSHYHCYNDDRYFDYRSFSRKYIQMAVTELRFILETFAGDTSFYGIKVPVGDERALLFLAQIGSYEIAKDMASSLWAYRLDHIIYKLMGLSERLSKFNEGSGGFIGRNRGDAVRRAINGFGGIVPVFEEIISGLKHMFGVSYNYKNKDYPYRESYSCTETIDVNRTLKGTGAEITVSLFRHFVSPQSIVVSSIAYGMDAQVAVSINGKIKGTMYVPQHDPKYSFQVKEPMKDVTFHVTRGKTVKIMKIEVNYCHSK